MKPVPAASLGRRPNSFHLANYKRLWSLLIACDRPETVPLPPGRSGFEFIARLIELEHFASSQAVRTCTQARLRGPQQAVFCGKIDKEFAFVPEEEFSAVQPYRSLKTERLKLSGTGAGEMEDYLLDNLWQPFVEPDILFHHHVAAWDGPVFTHEDRNENLALARLWDSRGLLAVFMSHIPAAWHPEFQRSQERHDR